MLRWSLLVNSNGCLRLSHRDTIENARFLPIATAAWRQIRPQLQLAGDVSLLLLETLLCKPNFIKLIMGST